MLLNRRGFLTNATVMLGGAALCVRRGNAQSIISEISEKHASEAELRALATVAVDAARSAGAMYADIRLGERHELKLTMSSLMPVTPGTDLSSTLGFGIRVLVNGTWAFVHGTDPSRDKLALMARDAVAIAKGYSANTTHRIELESAPVVTGEWSTPYQIDPFHVPLYDQAALLGAYRAAALRVHNGSDLSKVEFNWTLERRVFASTEGSLITQILRRSEPWIGAFGSLGMGDRAGGAAVGLLLPTFGPAAGGYETVTSPDLQDRIKAHAEEMVRLASLRRGSLEGGRYPVVFDGASLGVALSRTLGSALEADRVLGYEADGEGTSYLSPPEEMLGVSIASPLLTVKAHRSLPTPGAVKWDDEGVEAKSYDLITRGRITNYHTSRDTTPALRSAYEQRRWAVRPLGCVVAPHAEFPAMIRMPHLDVVPVSTTAGLNDLIKSIKKGVLVRGASHFVTDHQRASIGLIGDSQWFLIEKGQVVRRLHGLGLQLGTSTFWKALTAIGDATTLLPGSSWHDKGQPWTGVRSDVTAPAGLVKDVNVGSTRGVVA